MNKKSDSPKMHGNGGHGDREDLAGEHPYGDAGQIVALLTFLAIWILDSFIFHFSTILAAYVPLYIRLIFAAASIGLALYLAQTGHNAVFKEIHDPPQVIKTGIFSHVRHPLYLAVLLFYLGLIFTTLSLVSLLLLCVIFVFYDHIASFEEQLLEQKFGQEYTDYLKHVPKWLLQVKPLTFD
jgi:protein-S-isoprenylcysteine O-methyltransferase Ste14